MARTTVDIDDPILEQLRRLKAKERKSMGKIVSELLTAALAARKTGGVKRSKLRWVVKDLHARFDVGDKERLWSELDREQFEADASQ